MSYVKICHDMLFEIAKYLDDIEMIQLISCSKEIYYSKISEKLTLTKRYDIDSVKHCIMRYNFTKLLCHRKSDMYFITQSCIDILFDNEFDETILFLPNWLIKLSFGDKFNKYIYMLPDSLIYLIFGFYYDKPLPVLPSKLKYLTVSYSYRHSINYLPDTLQQLILINNVLTLRQNDLSDILMVRHYFFL